MTSANSTTTSTPTTFKPTDKQVKATDLLASRATHCALGGGARSGKTFWLLRALVMRSNLAPGSRHGVFRFRFNSLHASVIEDTFPKMMRLCFPEGFYNPKRWNRELWYYEFHNGSQIWFGGLDDKERVEKILGQEFASLYFNECSQLPYHSIITAHSRLAQKAYVVNRKGTKIIRNLKLKCYYDFNPPSKRHWTYQLFVDKRDPTTRKYVDDEFDYAYMQMNPEDNEENLSPEYLKFLAKLPPAARKRFLEGVFADDTEGQLWTDELLDQQRYLPNYKQRLPQFVRVVIAVDPSGCEGEEDTRSDEIGIIVVGLGTDGNGYVLEDLSGRYGPGEWAEVVASAYERHQADMIVGERNYGGAMVEYTIQAKNPNLPVTMVTASRGKRVRAEPIATLYGRHKIFHVGYFPELEDQLCSFTQAGYQGLRSPDRADALVWAVSELFPGIVNHERKPDWTPPKVETRSRGMSRFER